MKKLTILTALIGLSLSVMAQTGSRPATKEEYKNGPTVSMMPFDHNTPETNPVKPQYQKVVIIPVEDFQSLTGGLNDFKESVIYNPNLTDNQSREIQKQITAYLKDLPARIKLDSVKADATKKK